MTDEEAYKKYPNHHNWFNKLYISELFGYNCGPCGTTPDKEGKYVVRPIYNLSGMGAGASVKQIAPGDYLATPPGYFWCEYFSGTHYSANYQWKNDFKTGGQWVGVSCWKGIVNEHNLTKFAEWRRVDFIPTLPWQLDVLRDVKEINVEFKNDRIVEVHLRASPDPAYDHFIPVWKSDLDRGVERKIKYYQDLGYVYLWDRDDADGHIEDYRIGFLAK